MINNRYRIITGHWQLIKSQLTATVSMNCQMISFYSPQIDATIDTTATCTTENDGAKMTQLKIAYTCLKQIN